MPGIKLLTKLDAKTCLKLAWRAAQDQGYSLTSIDEFSNRFRATKGSALVGMLAGGLAPYSEFHVSVETYSDGNEIVLEKNTPWLTSGKMGVSKVNQRAEELLQAITRAVEREGSTILERREF